VRTSALLESWDTIEAVLIFCDADFFRARYSRCFLLLSSLCSSVISVLRFRCCLFLSSLLALAMLAGVVCGAEAYIFLSFYKKGFISRIKTWY
jgi:hypothetical protein